jgi:hypothetical protein
MGMRLMTAVTLGCAVLLAAPASSARADSGVRDFEQRIDDMPGQGARTAAEEATVTLDPGRPFDLVGFRWSKGQPRFEIRSYGSLGWSPWTPAGYEPDHSPDRGGPRRERTTRKTSEPVWTGPSSRVKVRIVGRVSGLRAHFVDISAPVQRKLAAAATTGGVAPGGSAPGSTTPGGSTTAPAESGQPDGAKSDVTPPPAYVTRAQWGANSRCKPRRSSGYGEVLGAAVHHTVSSNTYSAAQAPSVVLAICRFHRYSRGWNDVGYNALIDRFGTIYEGRAGGMARAVVGAHAAGFNSQATGVSIVGDHMTTPVSAEALNSLRSWLAWKLPLHEVTFNERVAYMSTGGGGRYAFGKIYFGRVISGHRDFGSTTCPGNLLYNDVAGLQSLLAPSTRLPTRLSIRMRRGASGSRSIYVTGRIRGSGALLRGKPVAIQAFGDAGWKSLATVESDQDGIYRATVKLPARAYLRAAFVGDGDYRSGRSVWKYSPKLP